MATIVNNFAKGTMDSDTHYSYHDNKGYVYALNLRPTGEGKDGVMQFVKGSEKFSDYSEDQTMTVVGQYKGENNKLYTFLARKDGLSKITETDVITGEQKLIVEDVAHLRFDLLRWEYCNYKWQKYLTNINQVDNMLYFSSDVWEFPRALDLTKDYTEFDLEQIILPKKPPFDAPVVTTDVNAQNTVDEKMKNRFVSFAYRYKYADNSYSTFSFYSDTAFREGNTIEVDNSKLNKAFKNTANGFMVTVNSGGKHVKGIEVIAREHGTNNGYVIYSAEKGKTLYNGQPITDNQSIAIKYGFSSNYNMVGEDALDLLYSRVPKFPKAQEYVGSRLFYANYKEDYDLKTAAGNDVQLNIDYELSSSDINYNTTKKTIVSQSTVKVGIVYMDDFNESTTVLLNSNGDKNEVYVPFENRTKINKILAKVNNQAPHWATKFKFVVQSQKLNYENIYSGNVRKIVDKLYVLLDSSNINKVKVDDKVFLTDSHIPTYHELTVKEVRLIREDEMYLGIEGTYAIIEGAKDVDIQTNEGVEGRKLNGKLKQSTQPNWEADLIANTVTVADNTAYEPNFGAVKAGDRVRIKVSTDAGKYNSADSYGKYSKTISLVAQSDYPNVYDFITAQWEDPFYSVANTTTQITFTPTAILYDWFINTTKLSVDTSNIVDWYTIAEVHLERGSKAQFIRTINKEESDTYFFEGLNTYRVINGVHVGADANGKYDIGFYNGFAWGNGIESYKIEDAFNARQLDWRFRPNAHNPSGYGRVHRKNDIAFGDVYNSDYKLNRLNIFNPAKTNFKELPNEYGEIQKIIATEGDITVICNDAWINQYYGKSIIMDLQGNENVALSNEVLAGHQVLPYSFGTQNPESVIKVNQNVFAVDKKRARYLIKGGREIMELNGEGSGHHFRGVKEIQAGSNFISSYHEGYSEILVGIDHKKTVVFNPDRKGFSHYYNYPFDYLIGMNGSHFSAYEGIVYKDEASPHHNSFVGRGSSEAKITFIVNPAANSDVVFQAMKLGTNTAWDVEIKTPLTNTKFTESAFEKKEGFYYSEIHRDSSPNFTLKGIGTVQSQVAITGGSRLYFSRDVDTEIASGDIVVTESNVMAGEIKDVQGNYIDVETTTDLTGIYVAAAKQSYGYASPEGAAMRGSYMEVTLTKKGSGDYYIGTVATEAVQSKL